MVETTNISLTHHSDFEFFNIHLQDVSYYQYIIYGILLPIFGGIGILCNILVFSSLFHKNRTNGISSLSLLLQCLSFYDFIVICLSLILFSIPTLALKLGGLSHYLSSIHPFLVPYLFPILHMGITGSDYLNLSAAGERYIALDNNFRKRKAPHSGCFPRTTWFYIITIFFCTIAFNLPLIWERKVSFNEFNQTYEIIDTELRHDKIYIKLYRLTMEFLVFKATPWISFLILFKSLKDRLKFYFHRKIRKTLTLEQFLELRDSRIILGINALFYVTNILALYISLCHILEYKVDPLIDQISNLMLVINSSLKFFIYIILSHDFRESIERLFKDEFYHWAFDHEKNHHFLGHTKVASFIIASKGSENEF